MATVNIQINGYLEFQSNATRDQGCHLVYMTFVDKNGNSVIKTTQGWWKYFAIRLKNNVNVGDYNPFQYNFSFDEYIDICRTLGCDVRLRIYIIPCCRANATLGPFTADTSNPLFEIATINTPTQPNASWDGFAIYEYVIQNESFYNKCFNYVVSNPISSNNLSQILSNNSGCPTAENENITPSNMILFHNNDVVLNEYVGFRFCTTNEITNNNNIERLTEECCNECKSYRVVVGPDAVNTSLYIVYQSCNNGQFITDRYDISTTGVDVTICAKKGSIFAHKYNSATNTVVTPFVPVAEISDCTPNCTY
ncbi:MAG: hypothetical protein KatS3mg002_1352 [Candidatus Woesearchaeota archaeon]|nr:MAG: hypothetical protein KatS3mg002_1352 [Candidatus Woesearchaeota archaeon]